jgi:hypothetical protein
MKVLLLLVVLAIFGLVSNEDYALALQAEKQYCASVAQWNTTGGELGHPDYDENPACK